MMPARGIVLVSQRMITDAKTGERRDALDQRWALFLAQCGLVQAAMPNAPALVEDAFATFNPSAVLLTGGNDVVSLGGDAPERDETERRLIAVAMAENIPLVGICRGMQMIQAHFGVPLVSVAGHVGARQTISYEGKPRIVNSYHNFGAFESVPELEVCGRADDGVIKAVRVPGRPIFGLMWHPERETPFLQDDIELMTQALKGQL